ncbi:MAG: porin family protein [Alphaproteobacteria bacterium]|nr:porin family protein [Alphaproteobacteria bacterium]
MKKALMALAFAPAVFAEGEEAVKQYDFYFGIGPSYHFAENKIESKFGTDGQTVFDRKKKSSKFGGSVFFGGMYFFDDFGLGLELGYDLAKDKSFDSKLDDTRSMTTKVRGCNPWLVAQLAYRCNEFIPALRLGMKHVAAEVWATESGASAVEGKTKLSKLVFTLGAGLRYNLCGRWGVEGAYDYAFRAKKDREFFGLQNNKMVVTQKLTGHNVRLAVTYSF